jgi:ubiquitin-conjugating enzyme E2 variant
MRRRLELEDRFVDAGRAAGAPLHLVEQSKVRERVPPATSVHGGRFHSFLEHAMLWVFPFICLAVLYFSFVHLYRQEMTWLVLVGLPLGFVLGDLVTGMVHWAADTYCSEQTPVIGKSLIGPFRMHHIYPKDICNHGLAETVGNTCILAVPLLSFCLWLVWGEAASLLTAFVVFTTVVMVAVTVATNQFHKWAHEDVPHKLVALLQRARIILEPKHHDGHHTGSFNSNYSITNGWLNPLLNRLDFFRRLERALSKIGIKPTRQ